MLTRKYKVWKFPHQRGGGVVHLIPAISEDPHRCKARYDSYNVETLKTILSQVVSAGILYSFDDISV